MPEGDYSRTELIWPGKRTQVERIALPFQIAETVNQSRATRERTPLLAGLPPPPLFQGQTNPDASWKNKLIWGENKYVLASLLQGDPSIGLEPLAGKVNLIYIDPPFATGQDFSYRARVGDEEWLKEASIIEEVAYRDTWGRGLDSYLQMMYERLVLMRELLAGDGCLYVHVGPNISHYVKAILDELFGEENYRNEIIWRRTFAHSDANRFGIVHDTLLFYSKNPKYGFKTQYKPHDESYIKSHYSQIDKNGRRYRLVTATGQGQGPARRFGDKEIEPPRGRHWVYTQEKIDQYMEEGRIVFASTGQPNIKQYLDELQGSVIQSIWEDVPPVNPVSKERLGFDTQKPEALIERIVNASSVEGELVADFFCGSGTTMAVAEKLGRRWIGGDLSRYAIQVSRKRMLNIRDCQPFQVLNLGKYERQHWQVNVNGSGLEPEEAMAQYQRFIVALYRAEPASGYAHLHGQKAGRWVHVGATDAPVTRAEVMDAVRECQANRYTGLDVLGWEWEMGLHDTVREEARSASGGGVDLRLLVIPREVMDKRAVQAGDVRFYELAYLKTFLLQDGRTVTVRLEDFIIPNPDLVPEEVRGKVKKWSDYIDFWAVDWNYPSASPSTGLRASSGHGQDATFHNEWQMYRTRKSPTLRLISDPHTYPEAGEYRILVKVIDIFGNDTTQLIPIAVT